MSRVATVATAVLLACAVAPVPSRALQRIYVANISAGTVAVVDADRRLVIDTIPVGRQPDGIAAAPDGSAVYVSNFADSTVSIIDTTTDTVAAVVPVDPGPVGLAVHPDGHEVYVACKIARTLVVIDTAQRAVVASIPIGQTPNDVVVSPTGDRVYVARSGGETIQAIATATRAPNGLLHTQPGPSRLAISHDGQLLYVSHTNGTITVLRVQSDTILFSGSGAGTAIALSPDEQWLYGAGSGPLSATTPDLEMQRYACGGVAPYDLLVLPNGRVVAADMRGDALHFFAAGLENGSVLPLDGGPFALAALPAVTPTLDLAIQSPPFGTRLDIGATVDVRVSVRSGAQLVRNWTVQLRGPNIADRTLASGTGAVVSSFVGVVDAVELTPGLDYEVVLQALAADETTSVRRVPLRVVPRPYALVPLEPSRRSPYEAGAAMNATGSRFVRWLEPAHIEVYEPQGAGRYEVAAPLPFTSINAPPLLSRDGRRITLRGEVNGVHHSLLYDLEDGTSFDIPPDQTIDLDGTGAHLAMLSFRSVNASSGGWNYDLYDVATQATVPITNSRTLEDVPPVCRPYAAGRPRISLAGDLVAFFTAIPLGGPPACNLYAYDVPTGMRRLVYALGDDGAFFAPTLDDAGARLAFLRRPAREDAAYPLRPELVDLASGTSDQLLADPTSSALAAAISGDGTAVVIASCADLDPAIGNPDFNEELFRYDTATRQFAQITNTRGGPQDCYERFGDAIEPRVSRDASVVAFRGLGFGPTTCGNSGAQREVHSGFAFGDTRAVRVDPTNTGPQLDVASDRLAMVGDSIEITATAEDSDGDLIAWFAELDAMGELPSNATFEEPGDGETEAVFRWDGTTPADVGTHQLRIGAFDGRGGDAVRTVEINVCRILTDDPIGDVVAAIFASQPVACGSGDANGDGVASAADLLIQG